MSFQAAAKVTLRDSQLRRNLGKATTTIRTKRANVVAELPDWEALRDAGEAIKARAMATLPEQLERLEALELLGQRRHRARLDRLARVAQRLPRQIGRAHA